MHRVVVTGWGVVSPIGNNATAYWQGLAGAVSGLAAPTLAPVEDLIQKVVAEVKGFDPSAHFDERQLVFLDRVAQFAVVAAREAIAQSGVSLAEAGTRSRVGRATMLSLRAPAGGFTRGS